MIFPPIYGEFANVLVMNRNDIFFTIVLRYTRNYRGGFDKKFFIVTETFGRVEHKFDVDNFITNLNSSYPSDIITMYTGDILFHIEKDSLSDPLRYFGILFSQYLYKYIDSKYGDGVLVKVKPQIFNGKTYTNLVSFRSPHRKISSYLTIKQVYAIKIEYDKDQMYIFVYGFDSKFTNKSDEFKAMFFQLLKLIEEGEQENQKRIQELLFLLYNEDKLEVERVVSSNIVSNSGTNSIKKPDTK